MGRCALRNSILSRYWNLYVKTRAPLGMYVCEHPLRFFVNNFKTVACSAAIFGTPYHTSFPHMLWKFQTQFTQGQITRSRQVSLPHKKFECSSTLHSTPTDRLPWNFQRLVQAGVSIKCISQNFDIGDLRSGQYVTSPLQVNGRKMNVHFFNKNDSKHTQTSG